MGAGGHPVHYRITGRARESSTYPGTKELKPSYSHVLLRPAVAVTWPCSGLGVISRIFRRESLG